MNLTKLIILYCAICFSIVTNAQVQEQLVPNHVISAGTFLKIDSISDKSLSFFPEIYMTYESNMSENLTGFFRLNIILPLSIDVPLVENPYDSLNSHKANGFGISLGARYYINEAFKGFYVGPAVSYYRYNHSYLFTDKNIEKDYSITSVRGSMAVGYQKIFANNFVLHIYLAMMLDHKNFARFKSQIETEMIGSGNYLKPDIGVSVGYYF
jgi:hypothetical protein